MKKLLLISMLLMLGGCAQAPLNKQTTSGYAEGVFEGRVGVGMALPVVLITLPIQIERQFGDLFITQIGIAGIQDGTACRFLSASRGSLLQASLIGAE